MKYTVFIFVKIIYTFYDRYKNTPKYRSYRNRIADISVTSGKMTTNYFRDFRDFWM